jgi:hypothetical protein
MVIVPAPCAQHRNVVDAPVLVEALVFGGEDRLAHDVGDILDLHDRPPLLPEFPQKLSFRGQDSQGDLGLIVGQGLKRG